MGDKERERLKAYQLEHFSKDAHDSSDRAAQSGATAIKSSFLANGAAILALLTFLGNTNVSVAKEGIFWAFVWFSSGIAASLFAQLAFYRSLANTAMRSFDISKVLSGAEFEDSSRVIQDWEKRQSAWLRSALGALMSSIGLFIVGAFVALDAIT